jgi:ketosteroid isomerase-like protein
MIRAIARGTVVAFAAFGIPLAIADCGGATAVQTRHPASTISDEQAIRAARSAQNEAIAKGDIARVAEFWTDDVEIRRGLGQLLVGTEAYRSLFTTAGSTDSAVVYQREAESVEVSSKWPLAYERGTWEGHIGSPTGPVIIRGRYGAQWVKRDGRWLIRGELYVALECDGSGCGYSAAP